MLQFTKAQIKEIATHLDGDDRCYVHPETGEFVFWPDFEETRQDPEKYVNQLGEKRRAKYDESTANWVQIQGMRSRDELRIMEGFMLTVPLGTLRTNLSGALTANRPFAAFRAALNSHDEWLQKWFQYKEAAWLPWVMRQLEAHAQENNEE